MDWIGDCALLQLVGGLESVSGAMRGPAPLPVLTSSLGGNNT